MTLFSTILSEHIKNKNIRTSTFALYCGIDRSNMYKLINGKRNPSSEETVHKMADFMRLTPTERKEILEAYEITRIGYDTYYRRKNVQDFIRNFFSKPDDSSDLSGYFSPALDYSNMSDKHSISGGTKLKHTLYAILALEARRDSGYIKLLYQPDSDDFMDVLASICKNREYLTIDHIICLNNTDSITADKRDYNLSCLQKIIPMYTTCLCEYTPFCYYDSILSHNSNFNLLSSMIVTADYAIIFSPQLEYGILFTSPNTLEKFNSIFDNLKAETTPVICKIDSFFTQFEYFNSLEVGEHPGFSFQREPCFTPLLPHSFPEKYLVKSMPDREAFVCSVKKYIQQKAEAVKSVSTDFIFTENGIRKFLQTGRIFELPEDIYNPIDPSDRALVIRNLINACQNLKYRMLLPDAPIAASTLCIYVTAHNGYLLFSSADGNLVYLNLEEPSLLTAFYDYLGSMEEELFYTKEETLSILKKLLLEKRG